MPQSATGVKNDNIHIARATDSEPDFLECIIMSYSELFLHRVGRTRSQLACQLTLKNSFVDPESSVPYAISVCLARSSALSMGETIRSTVKKAARLAVYDEIMMSVKNHHTPPTMRPERDLNMNKIIQIFLSLVPMQDMRRRESKRHCHYKERYSYFVTNISLYHLE